MCPAQAYLPFGSLLLPQQASNDSKPLLSHLSNKYQALAFARLVSYTSAKMMHREIAPQQQPQYESFIQRRLARNPDLAYKLHQMALPLSPLVQLTTGAVHPDFPRTVLQFWLLTDAQLEGLAHFYHQRTPSPWSTQYPCPVVWRSDVSLEEKRRKMGKFIGLRGCDSPSWFKTEGEIAEEARLASVASVQEDVWRRKLHPW